MIPDWLEEYREWGPDEDMYGKLTGKDRIFALFQEVITHYFWLYSNLEISDKQDRRLRNQFAQMQMRLDDGISILNAGPTGGALSNKARKILKGLMAEAVKHEKAKDSYAYLFDNLNQIDPSIWQEMKTDDLRKICRDYFNRHKAKYTQ